MKVFLAADHGGFLLKEKVKVFLEDQGYAVEDFGAHSLEDGDDYPDYVFPLAEALSGKEGEVLGLAFCRSGSGEAIAANKVRGIRATLSFSPEHAAKAREDNDANLLCLPSDYLDEDRVKKIVKAFLTTPFSSAERHRRRLQKIENYEEKEKSKKF